MSGTSGAPRSTLMLAADTDAARQARHAARALGDRLGLRDADTAIVELLTTELVLNCVRVGAQAVTVDIVTDEANRTIQVAVAPWQINPDSSETFPDVVAITTLERYARVWNVDDEGTARTVSFVFGGTAGP